MATNIFNPQEILRIAVQVEENGKNLYGILESKAKDTKLKEMWRYLKEQEELHRKVFQQMLDNVGDYIVYEVSPGEYDAYMRVIASSYILTQELIEKRMSQLFASDAEAIDFGIYIEKESILTYSALKEYVLTAKQPVIDKVIDEEKKHLVQLTLLKDQMKPQ
ncbi:MAG: ferritin family protein [Candidatus Omnitrophota bacterium]|nr:MAG: ferritin family protein [Candidatus Omnitrophota bacterium]